MKTWTADEVAYFLRLQTEAEDRDLPLWRVLVSTGCRRGEALGTSSIDLSAGTATIRQTVIVVAHVAQLGSPKPAAGARTIDLDPATVTALQEHRQRQAAERLLIGAGWKDNDLAFAAPDVGAPGWCAPEGGAGAIGARIDHDHARHLRARAGGHGSRGGGSCGRSLRPLVTIL